MAPGLLTDRKPKATTRQQTTLWPVRRFLQITWLSLQPLEPERASVFGFQMLTTGGLLLTQITHQATSVTVRPAQVSVATVALLRTAGSAAHIINALLVLFARALSVVLVLIP